MHTDNHCLCTGLFTSPPANIGKSKDGEYRRASSTSEVGDDTEKPREEEEEEEARFLGGARQDYRKWGLMGDVEALRALDPRNQLVTGQESTKRLEPGVGNEIGAASIRIIIAAGN
ncbi:hypothetical protein PG996_014492 [Apiospora saccharicola]|uniref:Uncharacterized protein n=1 Tax=Apiospora saccharicola TaxID=335842 RepID=A0ABR1TL77_9PEZI